MQSVGEHIRLYEGTVINGRYRVVAECGSGNFARVYRCVDQQNNAPVALKFLKREYARDASFEVDVLKAITRTDSTMKERVLHLNEYFVYNRYPCFVFPLRGNMLKARKYGISTSNNVAGGFSRDEFQVLVQDLLNGLHFLHNKVKVVHTDLKPENILLERDSSNSASRAFYIADFGSASFYQGKLESDLISTRPYRSPEVVSGYGWSYAADVWSMGCILFEVFTGQSFIPHTVHTDHEQLVCMQQRTGVEFPSMMVGKCKQRRLFDMQHKLLPCPFRRDKLRSLREVLHHDELLMDLLQRMLHQDPTQRIRAEQIIDHPFITAGASSRSSSVGGLDIPSLPLNAQEPTLRVQTRGPIPAPVPTSSSNDRRPVPSAAALDRKYSLPSSTLGTPRGTTGIPAPTRSSSNVHMMRAAGLPSSSLASSRLPRHEYGYGLSR